MKVIKYNTELDAYKKNILVMENSTNYAILVVGARLGFLTASGLSDEEAMQIIAPESEDTTG